MSQIYTDIAPRSSSQMVMLATTVYDGPDASYTFSIAKSREALTEAGIQSAYVLLSGNCHVDDGRNTVVHEFLQSDCTDLVFLDADVSWEAEDLVTLCQYDLDLVGGVYPYRRPDANGMPFLSIEGIDEPVDGLIQVGGLPTGFMRIRRKVLEDMVKVSPTFNSAKDGRENVALIFERVLTDGVRWGGDLNFCNKYRDTGGKIYAATEMRLGHACKTIITDSLGASIRRSTGKSIQYVADKVKVGTEVASDYTEALEFIDNRWGADEEVLFCAVAAARKADGPIIETGSGLTTVLMAAATDQTVWCIEHNEHFANQTRELARSAGVSNIAIVHCDIKDGWYDITDDLAEMPDHFAVGLNDGPPRAFGDRMKFFEVFGDKCDLIIADDANVQKYADKLKSWAGSRNRSIHFPETCSAIIMKEAA